MRSFTQPGAFLPLLLLVIPANAQAAPTWVATVTPLLNAHGNDIPLDFLLGWIAVESDGRNEEVTRLNERGYFQIHPDESKELHFDHTRLTTDRVYSVESGITLVRHYADRAKAEGFSESQDFFWRIVKLNHAMGAGAVTNFIKDMKVHRVEPSSWSTIASYAETNQIRLRATLHHDPVKWIGNVDDVIRRGRELAAAR